MTEPCCTTDSGRENRNIGHEGVALGTQDVSDFKNGHSLLMICTSRQTTLGSSVPLITEQA
ncbi:hypothetical protein M6B38_126665 [Iris pallida]|uniref:Uncharacterized protein n=1 Tax=Iris pallida TaxID=29817 RepID=A0AAX6GH48_IRIPA|nr:hypothetical protein M6B38_126665 [Iris pallida]